MPHSYLGRDDLKRSLGSTMSAKDADLRRALEGVSEQIDQWLNRTFRTLRGTRYFTAMDAYSVDVDDLLSVEAVRLDQSRDRSYNTTLSTSDYELEPWNAPEERKPYRTIVTAPNGSYRFDSGRRGVQVVGTWGYWQDLVSVGARLSTALDATSTSLALASSTTLQPQQTVLIGSEQIYLGDLSTAGMASVERGVNGTVAAEHTTADAIQVYRYPPPVVEACRLQALRLHKRTDAPLGIMAGGLDVTEGVVQVMRLDPDVEKLLETYRRYEYLAV
jgi:hypothetical protein